jgi:hypothetical protein
VALSCEVAIVPHWYLYQQSCSVAIAIRFYAEPAASLVQRKHAGQTRGQRGFLLAAEFPPGFALSPDASQEICNRSGCIRIP